MGPKRKFLALAMYISFFWVSISFALGPVFQWNIGFTVFKVLHIYYILMRIDHVLDIPNMIGARIDSSQDYVLRADLSWHQIPLGMSTPRSIPKMEVRVKHQSDREYAPAFCSHPHHVSHGLIHNSLRTPSATLASMGIQIFFFFHINNNSHSRPLT